MIDTSVILRLLVKDESVKIRACERLLLKAKEDGTPLHLPPIVIMEIVWVLEKVYKYKKKEIREIVEAVLNTAELKIEMEWVFRNALRDYEEKNIKFADAVIGYWGLEKGLTTVYTFDEKDFKRIEGIEVKKP